MPPNLWLQFSLFMGRRRAAGEGRVLHGAVDCSAREKAKLLVAGARRGAEPDPELPRDATTGKERSIASNAARHRVTLAGGEGGSTGQMLGLLNRMESVEVIGVHGRED